MSEEETHGIIGRDVVEYVELGRTCATLEMALYFIARDLQEVARDVDKRVEPSAEKLDKLPTATKIRETIAAHAEANRKRDERHESLRRYGVFA